MFFGISIKRQPLNPLISQKSNRFLTASPQGEALGAAAPVRKIRFFYTLGEGLDPPLLMHLSGWLNGNTKLQGGGARNAPEQPMSF